MTKTRSSERRRDASCHISLSTQRHSRSLPYSMMIRLAVSIEYRRVTDRQTDSQIDRQTDILRQHSPRYAQHRMVMIRSTHVSIFNVHRKQMTVCPLTHRIDKYGRFPSPADDEQVVSYTGSKRHCETNR